MHTNISEKVDKSIYGLRLCNIEWFRFLAPVIAKLITFCFYLPVLLL